MASRNPQPIEPGLYTAVLEPQAVNDLVPLLGNALDARSADEGRSPFSKPGGGNRIGEKVVDERVTLYSDPADRGLLGAPFDVRRPADWPHGVDREGHPEEPRLHALLGGEAGRAADRWRRWPAASR